MQDYIKKFKKIIVLLCISIIAGGVIMGGYAGIHYIKAGDNKVAERIVAHTIASAVKRHDFEHFIFLLEFYTW